VRFYCEMGFHARLFELLGLVETFIQRVHVFHQICALMGSAHLAEAQALMGMGFIEALSIYIKAVVTEIPHAILDAMGTIERLAEMEGQTEWFGRLFGDDNVVASLQTMCSFSTRDPEDRRAGVAVCHSAQGLWSRNENLPIA